MKKQLLTSVLLIGLGAFSLPQPVEAFGCPGEITKLPLLAMDLGRSVTGIIQGVIELCGDGDAKAELIAVQEETNENADGSAGSGGSGGGTGAEAAPGSGSVGGSAMSGGAYAYVKSEIMGQANLSQYPTLQANLSNPVNVGHSAETCEAMGWTSDTAKQTCIAVVNTFFADKGEGNTEGYVAQIQQQRQEYGNLISERHIRLGYNVQQKIISDLLAAASAPVASDNEVGSIAVDGQTLDEMLKIVVADLALQIEMMEADAMNFMLQQPVRIIKTEEKPASVPPAETPAA